MNEASLLRLLDIMDIAVIECRDGGALIPLPPLAAWLRKLFPLAELEDRYRLVVDELSYLGNFLIDARDFWASSDSGHIFWSSYWTDTVESGEDITLKAGAVRLDNRKLLLLNRISEHDEKEQVFLQIARENKLSSENLSREEHDLEILKNYLEREVGKRTEQLRQAMEKLGEASLETIYRLARAAEYRDQVTHAHIQRVSRYSGAIAQKLGLDAAAIKAIIYASPMHDIGKIGIPDGILLKKGSLKATEYEIIKQHTSIGSKILSGSESEYIKLAEIIALTHHERWDGSGYPRGLKGKDIPLSGRITAVADVFDALSTKRPYKQALPAEAAFQEIAEKRGSYFDPEVVDAFFAIKNQILFIKNSTA